MLGLLGSLGLGSQLTIAATLLIAAFYLWRLLSVAAIAASFASHAMIYILLMLVVSAVAIGAGWVAPRPGQFLEHAAAATSVAARSMGQTAAAPFRGFLGALVEFLRGLIG